MEMSKTKTKYTEQQKMDAATELMNAKQALRELGTLISRTDMVRLRVAEKAYKKITGRNP